MPNTPSSSQTLHDIKQNKPSIRQQLHVLLAFVRQDLIERYSGSLLGGAWSLVMPLIQILIFTLIFSKIMGMKLATFGADLTEYGYSIYLVSGILAWNAFSTTMSRTSKVFLEKAALIKKVPMSLKMLPLYIPVSETVIFVIAYLFFTVFLVLIGYQFSWLWLWLPVIYVLHQMMAWAIGFICGVLSVFIRDINQMVDVGLQVWFWATPIVYVLDIVPETMQTLMSWNPAFWFIDSYHQVILYQKMPEMSYLIATAGIGGLALIVAYKLLGKLEKDLRDFI
ncbi:MAG: ABC transporter permease [Oceanospirillum sp.]|nr:ABC transporter permease [Oceanospirillum sp.]